MKMTISRTLVQAAPRLKLGGIRTATSGIAAMEFAIVLPFFMALGLYGVEVANMAATRMQVSQLALSVADNASRLGQTDNSSVTPTITEAQIDSVMTGAEKQGASIDFANKGRVILSSLERDSFTGRQWFHWQRCRGALVSQSLYGDQNTKNGKGTFRIYGVGTAGNQVTAINGSAVMVAEIYYRYDGLFGNTFINKSVFRQEAAFIIRDDRNLTPGVSPGTSKSACPTT